MTDKGEREFGQLLRSFRLAAGLSQAGLAERAGLSMRGVSDLERGARRAPYAHTVEQLAEALDLAEPDRYRLASASRRRVTPGPPTSRSVSSPLTSLIGRDQAVTELLELLGSARLTTLTGTGGIGKTRLALTVAARAAEWHADGLCVVELASVSDPLLVPNIVAAALGVRDAGQPVLETLIAALRTRHMLLVLDNCEHLTEACAALVATVLRATTNVRILATSREPLGLTGEWLWSVPPLGLPTAGSVLASDIAEIPSVQLFVDRALAARRDFRLTNANAPAVADVCRQLDGIPLALELAAARTRVLTVAQIATRLGDSLRLLSNLSRSPEPRHQTLRATIDWSFGLLQPAEQRLFSWLSVFAGGWTIEAAEAVCIISAPATEDNQGNAGVAPGDGVLDLLARLVDRSLVIAEPGLSDAMRYHMLETLRQYAAERLAETGETALVRDRHLTWFVGVSEQAERDLWQAQQVECLNRLYLDRDNLRAALAWSMTAEHAASAGMRIASALPRLWDFRGSLREAIDWLAGILALPGAQSPTPIRAKALTAYGYCLTIWGERSVAIAALDESLALYRGFGQPAWLAAPIFFRGFLVTWIDHDPDSAEPWFNQSLGLARQHGPAWTMCCSLFGLGDSARLRGDFKRADTLLAECRAMSRRLGDRWVSAYALFGLGISRLQQGDVTGARPHLEEALQLTLELGDMRGTTYALECLARLALGEGLPEHATRLFGAAQRLREPVGDVIMATLRVDREQFVTTARTQLGTPDFEMALAAGQSLSLGEVIAEAFRLAVAADH